MEYLLAIGWGIAVAAGTVLLVGGRKAAGLPGGSFAVGAAPIYNTTHDAWLALLGGVCGLVGWLIVVWVVRHRRTVMP